MISSRKTISSHKCKGIGLLELMLALVVISTLIVMATRYYESASQSQKLAQTVADIRSVVAAERKWRVGQNLATATPPSISTLTSMGLLPKEWGDGSGANAWGGAIWLTEAGWTYYWVGLIIGATDCVTLASMFPAGGNISVYPPSGTSCWVFVSY